MLRALAYLVESSRRPKSPLVASQLSAADKRRQLPFGRLYIAHESIFVFQKIDIRPWNVAMQQALFDFTDDEIESFSAERGLRLPFECLQVVNRNGALDAGAERDLGEIRATIRRRRLADSRAAVRSIVENENREIIDAEVRDGREAAECQQHPPVPFEGDDAAMRQRGGDTGGDGERRPHLAEQQVAFMLREMA